MKSCKSTMAFTLGLILSAFVTLIFFSSSISASDAEMSRISLLCEQLEIRNRENRFLKLYFSEIRKGLNEYYQSNSKHVNNEIIVKWWDKLSEMDSSGVD